MTGTYLQTIMKKNESWRQLGVVVTEQFDLAPLPAQQTLFEAVITSVMALAAKHQVAILANCAP